MQALRNLGLGWQPEGPGLELAWRSTLPGPGLPLLGAGSGKHRTPGSDYKNTNKRNNCSWLSLHP